MCGTAFKNKGVQALLDAVIEYMPSPIELPPTKGLSERGETITRTPEDGQPFSALAFKILNDPFVGNLTFFRVYSGTLNSGDTVYVPSRSKKERIGRLLQMHANERSEIKEVHAGDIAAAVGLKDVYTGDTLSDLEKVITLEKMTIPIPVISVAVEPKTQADQEKMSLALQRLAKEDPSFRVSTDEESAQTIISGMGELHLEIIVDRMRREFKVEANVGKPQVAYRETIRAQGRERRQTHQAVRRPRPVRARVAQDRAQRAGQGQRIHQWHRRRQRAARVHSGGGEGHQGSDRDRRDGGLSRRRHQGHAVRRLVPRRRLRRNFLPHGRDLRFQGWLPQGEAR